MSAYDGINHNPKIDDYERGYTMKYHHTERTRIEGGYHIKCIQCGTWFFATRDHAAFCSSTCRSRYQREEEAHQKRVTETLMVIEEMIERMPRNHASGTQRTLLHIYSRIGKALMSVDDGDRE